MAGRDRLAILAKFGGYLGVSGDGADVEFHVAQQQLAVAVAARDLYGEILLEQFLARRIVDRGVQGGVAFHIFFVDDEEVADGRRARLCEFVADFHGDVERLVVMGDEFRIAFEPAGDIHDARVAVHLLGLPSR